MSRSATRILLVAVAAAATVVATGLLANNYMLQTGTSLAMSVVLALAWNIVGGYMGYPSFATATLFGVGVYATAIAETSGITMAPAWALAGIAGAVFALLLGLVLLRLRGHYFAMGTIATVEVMAEIATNWESLTGGAVGLDLPIRSGSPEAVGRFFFLAMWVLAALAVVATIIVDRSRFGFGLRCICQNESAASMVGARVLRYKVAAFVLSGTFAALAGAVYASMVAFVQPKDAFNLITSIEVPVMTMLGGAGTIVGPIVGSALYVVLNEYVWARYIDYHAAILGVIIVAVIYFLPEGVVGLVRRASRPGWLRARLGAIGGRRRVGA